MKHQRRKLFVATAGFAGVVLVAAAAASPAAADHAPSARASVRTYTVVGAVAASTPITVHVALPLRHRASLEKLTQAQVQPGSASYHKWLSPQSFRLRYGVTDAQLAHLRTALASQHVVVTPAGAQAVSITGTAADVAKAFSTTFERVREANGTVRTASATVMKAPTAIKALGGTPIDITPAVRMRTNARLANRYGTYGAYWFDDLKQAYKYPAYGKPARHRADGTGQTIGILMSSAPSVADADAYFAHEGLTAPKISVENIEGGAAFSTTENPASLEANLDVQQSGGVAPRAKIIVYNIPDLSDNSVFAGYVAIDEDDTVDVASSSFGGCELSYTAAYNNGTSFLGILHAYDDLYMQGVSQGITFVASSGDEGALECTTPSYELTGASGTSFQLGVSSPADDPNVTAVGGTNLVTSYAANSLTSRYIRENASADSLVPFDYYGLGATVSGGYWGSGGGFSRIFTEPTWQKANTTNKSGFRSLPDVSLHMGGCPSDISLHCNPEDSADIVEFGGSLYGVVGTSASAPDFAGTVALYNQAHGGARSGNINPVLYADGAAQRSGAISFSYFHEGVPGNNGYYNTAYTDSGGTSGGYDEVIGNGTLIAKNFVFGRPGTPGARDPQTPTNP